MALQVKKPRIQFDNSWMKDTKSGIPEGAFLYSVEDFKKEGYALRLTVQMNKGVKRDGDNNPILENGKPIPAPKPYIRIYEEDKRGERTFVAAAYLSEPMRPTVKAGDKLNVDEFQLMYVTTGTLWNGKPVVNDFILVVRNGEIDDWA